MNTIELVLEYADKIRMTVPAPAPFTMNEEYAKAAAEELFTRGTHHTGRVVGARCKAPSGYVFFTVGDCS